MRVLGAAKARMLVAQIPTNGRGCGDFLQNVVVVGKRSTDHELAY